MQNTILLHYIYFLSHNDLNNGVHYIRNYTLFQFDALPNRQGRLQHRRLGGQARLLRRRALLRDGGEAWMGKGVERAVSHVNVEIQEALVGMDVTDQRMIDETMIDLDGSENKENLGANAILGVSLAVAKAAAEEAALPLYRYIGGAFSHTLPTPMINIVNGGVHADNQIDFQEFMIVPIGADSISSAIRMGTEVFHTLKRNLGKANKNTNVGDEGGFAPSLTSAEEILDFIMGAIEGAGYSPGKDIALAIDAASSEFFKNGKYCLSSSEKPVDSDKMVQIWESLIKNYPINSLEDPMAEDDWNGWKVLT